MYSNVLKKLTVTFHASEKHGMLRFFEVSQKPQRTVVEVFL